MLRRLVANRAVRIGVALLAVGLGIAAIAARWDDVRRAAAQLDALAIAAALLAVLAGLFATMLSWRALLVDLGSPLPLPDAGRVFFLGQLGKYLPGSVWWLVGQVELAHDAHVPRRRAAAAGVLGVVLSLGSGLALAALTLPLLPRPATARFWPALAAIPLLAVALHPRVLNPGIDAALRLVRREPLERPLSPRGIATAFGWAVLAWIGYGLHVAVLAADLGASRGSVVPLSVGAFALAWSVGFLTVLVPAGIGVREAALTAAIAPAVRPGAALVVAVVSRVLMSGGDLVWAGVVSLRSPRRAGVPDPDQQARPR